MPRTLSVGLMLSLSLASLVYAQPPQGGQDQSGGKQPTTRPAQGERPAGRPPSGGRPGGGPGAGQGGVQGGATTGRPGGGGPGPGAGAGGGAGGGGGGGGGTRPPHHGQRPAHRPPAANPGAQPPTGAKPTVPTKPGARPVWRPGTQPNPWRQPTASNWYWNGRAMHRTRASAFVWPSGWTYRRWTAGAVLPRLFLTNVYFYTDWFVLGLPGPPPGFAWVRFGPDLLLVDLTTGRIVDIAYGVFF